MALPACLGGPHDDRTLIREQPRGSSHERDVRHEAPINRVELKGLELDTGGVEGAPPIESGRVVVRVLPRMPNHLS